MGGHSGARKMSTGDPQDIWKSIWNQPSWTGTTTSLPSNPYTTGPFNQPKSWEIQQLEGDAIEQQMAIEAMAIDRDELHKEVMSLRQQVTWLQGIFEGMMRRLEYYEKDKLRATTIAPKVNADEMIKLMESLKKSGLDL